MSGNASVLSNRAATLSLATLALTIVFVLTVRPLPVVSPQVVFSNTQTITINTNLPLTAALYPSTINVAGMVGTTTKVTISLFSFSHERPSDLDLLLVSPTGTKFIIMSDAIFFPVTNITLTLDSAAATSIPVAQQNLSSGSYRPTNYLEESPDTFPSPAPLPPYLSPFQEGFSTFAAFNGADPNGTWSLYVVDDTAGTSGTIAGGWNMSITSTGTGAAVFSNTTSIPIDDTRPLAAPSAPYPSAINVSGLSGVITNLKVTLSGLSHVRARDIDVLLVTPNGVGLVLMSDCGSSSANNVTLAFDDTAPTSLPSFNVSVLTTGTFKPSNYNDGDVAGVDVFPSPAPPPPYSSSGTLASLNGFSPNGTWGLYVVDDATNNAGAILGGWSLDITTGTYTPTFPGCIFPNFAPASNFNLTANTNPTGMAVGDFNNDNKQDLVVANQGNSISLLLGDGEGNFGMPLNFLAGTNPYAVATGNFNGDGNLDLAVVNAGSNNVSILLGNGSGGFTLQNNLQTGTNPISVAIGNFNNDANLDLAVANFGGFFAGTVSVFLGIGGGSFSSAVNYAVRTQPSYVAIGNFNGDANLDMAVSNFGSSNVSVLIGTGSGSFTAAAEVQSGAGPVALAVEDYDGNGTSDLAIANYNSNTISLRFGTGAGTFTGTGTVTAGTSPISVTTGDVNGDGKIDLVFADYGSNDIRVALNSGTGTFPSGVGFGTFSVGGGPTAVVAGNFNGGGSIDLATVNLTSDNVSVLLNACGVAKGNNFDFDSDRRTDFAIWRPSNGLWFILRSSNSSFDVRRLGISTDIIVPADYNGDATTDIGYFRPGSGEWNIPGTYFIQFGNSTDIPAPADYDGDGRADVATYRPSEGVWFLRFSTDNSQQAIVFGIGEDKPVPADYDGDGKADVAIFRPSSGTWYILMSSDNVLRTEVFGTSGDRPVAADYDGDGKADVAVFRPNTGAWHILQSSNGAIRFQSWGLSTDVPVPGDYDGDGKFDVAMWRPNIGWYVLRSLSGTAQYQSWGMTGDIPLPAAFIQ